MTSKKDSDLTRIEDLSDFIHDEDETDEGILLEDETSEPQQDTEQETSFLSMEKESFGEDTSFLQIPDELNSDLESEIDSADFPEESFNEQLDDDFSLDSTDSEANTTFESLELDTQSDDDQETEQEYSDQSDIDRATSFVADTFNDEAQDHNKNNSQIEEFSTSTEEKEQELAETHSHEDFKDIEEAANNMVYSDLSIEGNPPYSIVLKDLKFQEDAQDILSLLREFKVIKEDYIEETRNSLNRGSLLIPRLSEYSAIILCHKLRKFDIGLNMGLTKKIHAPESYESSDNGLISKASLYSNKSDFIDFEDKVQMEKIQVSKNQSIKNHKILFSADFKSHTLTIQNSLLSEKYFNDTVQRAREEIIKKLKVIAVETNCNGLLNLSFTQEQISSEFTHMTGSADLVMLQKIESNE